MKKETLRDILLEDHFRVAIFGSARIRSDDEHYIRVYNLAFNLGCLGIDVVTGGGPGLMEAANKGHQEGRMNNNQSQSLGINISLPFEQHPNKHLDLMEEKEKFSSRLDEFMDLSNVLIVAEGGIGTLLELLYCWQLMQVGKSQYKPIILLGSLWTGLIKWMMDEQLPKHLISHDDFRFIHIVKDVEEATALIESEYRKFLIEHPDYEEKIMAKKKNN